MTRNDDKKPFAEPVAIHLDGGPVEVGSAAQAAELLAAADWPGPRGPLHRDGLETCMKVLDGHRSTEDSRRAFIEAAREAGLLER